MLTFRDAVQSDCDLYFKWANDALVRKNSLNTDTISLQDHTKWFTSKINSPDVIMYVFICRLFVLFFMCCPPAGLRGGA